MVPALMKEQSDMVYISGLRCFQASMTAIIEKIKGTQTVLMAHCATPYTVEKSLESELLKRLYDLSDGYPAKFVNLFIVSSETEAQQYRAWGVNPEKIRVIPSGVDLNEFSHTTPEKFKDRLGFTDERILR